MKVENRTKSAGSKTEVVRKERDSANQDKVTLTKLERYSTIEHRASSEGCITNNENIKIL